MKKIFLIAAILFAALPLFAEDYTSYTPAESFFIEYMKMQKLSQDRLTLMNKKGTLSKLGTEQIDGLKSGTLTYKTKVSGFKGIVTLSYENYSDIDGWIFDGTITTVANMAADGTLGGTVVTKGVGSVTYDNAILKDGQPGGGTYGVTLTDGEAEQVGYELYFIAINN